VDAAIEQAVVNFAIEQPAYGQLRVSNELKQQGILVSPGGVRSIWLRQDLETLAKRLKALEATAAQDNLILTEAQLKALEKAKQEKEAYGEMRRNIRATWVLRTPSRSARLKGADASISKPSLTPTPEWRSSNCMR
jgi:D-alanyl-D-alanine carboxypeptidase